MKIKLIYLLSAVFALASAVVAGTAFPDITVDEVKTAISQKTAVILDVNGTESWRAGHVPGALDYFASKEKLASVLPKDKNTLVIAYCGNPRCHAYLAAAEAAKALGYTNIKHMSAGISGWKQAGAQIEKAE
mgnify:CR=1 FL=1